MKIVEFTGPEDLEQLKGMLKAIIKLANYNVRLAVDVDGFKASVDRGTWSPPCGVPQKGQ